MPENNIDYMQRTRKGLSQMTTTTDHIFLNDFFFIFYFIVYYFTSVYLLFIWIYSYEL